MSKEQQYQPALIAGVRASLYSALALGFSAPNEKTLRRLSTRLAAILQGANPLLVVSALEDRIKSLQASINDSDRSSLKAEYHRLFVGPYKLRAPPYASVYLETEPTIMGSSTLEALRIYEDAGFRLSPSFKDLPDHIAAELEFMALLCEQAAGAWQKEDFRQAEKLLSREETYLTEHLAQWIPKFSSKVHSSSESPFYRALVLLLRDYVFLDRDGVHALRALVASEGSTPTKEGTRDGA